LKNNKNHWIWDEKNIFQLETALGYKAIRKEDITQYNYVEINNRRYLGSKYKMLDFIEDVVDKNTEGIQTVADIFAGTGVVANLFRNKGKKIIINDILTSNYTSYRTWFGKEQVNYEKIKSLINHINNLEGFSGYVTENFGNKYFS